MRVISIDDLRSKGISFSKTHLYRLMNAGAFPKPIKIGLKRNAWSEEEVDAWLRSRFAQRDGEAA